MKIAIVNFSGNVGKSTIAKNLLKPRMDGIEIINIETINSDDSDGQKMKGKQFGQLSEQLMLTDDAIIDVGSSNIEDFVKLMDRYDGSHEDFDIFLIPVVKENKQVKDTIATINALSSMGVPPEKIRVVFNRLDVDDIVEEIFYPLFGYYEDAKNFTLRPKATIFDSELYQNLSTYQTTIEQLLNDSTDYKAKLRETNNPDEKLDIVARISLKRLAGSAKKNLDTVFDEIMR